MESTYTYFGNDCTPVTKTQLVEQMSLEQLKEDVKIKNALIEKMEIQINQTDWIIHDEIVDKVTSAFKSKMEELKKIQSTFKWGMRYNNEYHIFDNNVQVLIDDARLRGSNNTLIKNIHVDVQIFGNTRRIVFDIRILTDGTPVRCNINGHNEYDDDIIKVSEHRKDVSVAMNSFTLSLQNEEGGFLFQKVYDYMKRHPYNNGVLFGAANNGRLAEMATTFSTPFEGQTFSPDRSERWIRQSLARQFLSGAMHEWREEKENATCFIWAHETSNPSEIRDEPHNMTYPGTKGVGFYVASSDFVKNEGPLEETLQRTLHGHRGGGRRVPTQPCEQALTSFIIGVAVTNLNSDRMIERYRKDQGTDKEPHSWKNWNIPQQIFIKNPSLSSVLPLGYVTQ